MKIALTGHAEIEKCYNAKITDNGNKYDASSFEEAYKEIKDTLHIICKNKGIEFKDLVLISGMARGADEVLAQIAVDNNLPLILSIPHSVYWHKNRTGRKTETGLLRAQAINYQRYLDYPKSTLFEIKKNYNNQNFPYANFARNQHMVDTCDILISFKKHSSTGTDHCIILGRRANKYYGNVGDVK